MALLVVLVVMRVPWYGGLALFIPVALSAVGFLQASRNTCVMRAKQGTFEQDDFSTTKAPDERGGRQPGGRRQDQPRRRLIGLAGAAIGIVVARLFHPL